MNWTASDNPLVVDESADNDEPTDDDIESARQNHLTMAPPLREYVNALRRRFTDGTEDEDRRILD